MTEKKPTAVAAAPRVEAPQVPSICRMVVVRRQDGGVINSGAHEVPAVISQVHDDGTIDCCLFIPGVGAQDACRVPGEDQVTPHASTSKAAAIGSHRYVWSWPKR